MDSVKLLAAEHDNILRMLDVIHQASLTALSGDPVNVDDFKQMIDFIRKYADKAHHGKEEEFLFKAMVEELGNVGENLIRHGMLVEHDIGRLYVSDLDAALDDYAKGPTPEATLSILVAAGSYEHLLRRHIEKENTVIFPFGEKHLSKKALEWLQRETDDFEAKEATAALREQQLAILAALEKKYGGKQA